MITWQQFINNPENTKLTLREQKARFLLENSKQLLDLQAIQAMYGGAAGGMGFSGVASDGPIAGATVSSPGTGNATTDAAGRFTLPGIPTEEITVTGGTDAITGVAFTGELKGFPQYEVVSPMTTLAYHLKEEDTTLTADTAVDLLFASSSTLFGVELDVADKDVMLKKDYVAESILADNQSAIAAQSIATYLESVTSMIGSAVKGADSVNFTINNAKVEGYKSIARQIKKTSGAKTEINPQTLFDEVKLPDGSDWTGALTGSLTRTNRETIKTQLDNVRNQLGSLARSEAYSANYLTTQIQAINRGVKEDYAVEADRLAKGQDVTFDAIDEMIGKSTGSLAQIEDGRTNETTRSEGEKTNVQLYPIGEMTFTQVGKGDTVYTLAGDKYVSGSMQVIVADRRTLDVNEVVKKYLLKAVPFLIGGGDALTLEGASNYEIGGNNVTATQKTSTQDADGDNAGKVYQFTLLNPSLQIQQVELVAASSVTHITKDVNESGGSGLYKLSRSTGKGFTDPISLTTTTNKLGVTTIGQGLLNLAKSGYAFSSIAVAAREGGNFNVTCGKSNIPTETGFAFEDNVLTFTFELVTHKIEYIP